MIIKGINLQEDNTREMTPERVASLKKYLELNKKFENLRMQGILTSMVINKLQEEIDVDSLSEDQKNKQLTPEEIEAAPKKTEEYIQFLVMPFAIFEGERGREKCFDHFDTEVIDFINKRLEAKIEAYKEFIKEEESKK